MDEQDLILAAKQGDVNSFNQLVLGYQDLLYNQAFWILGDHESAQDATQDAFVSAFRSLRSYRGGYFKAWLLRIVTHACYDELRRRKRRPTVPLNPLDAEDEEIETPPWLVDTGELLEETVERSEQNQMIRLCLDALPPAWRAVVILVDLQGFDYAEAAKVLGMPMGTVKSRLARARLLLRQSIGAVSDTPVKFLASEEV